MDLDNRPVSKSLGSPYPTLGANGYHAQASRAQKAPRISLVLRGEVVEFIIII